MNWLTVDLGPGVAAAVTTRAGGVSEGEYESLNLAYHVGDDAARVEQNRARVVDRLGRPVAYLNQVHGSQVVVVDAPPAPEQRDQGDGDALVTTVPELGLAVMVADCLPVLLADPERGVVGVAHAGRRGLAGGVVPAAVATMLRLGARPAGIRAYLGPAICGGCYEVGEEVRADVAASVPQAAASTRWGTPSVDLAAGALAQLRSAGVSRVEPSGLCTLEDPRFYSYRERSVTGRFAGLVALVRPDTP